MSWHIIGYGRYRVCGGDLFSFLNECRHSGVELRNIYSENGATVLEIKNSDFIKCTGIAEKNRVKLILCGNYGLTSLIRAYSKRKVAFFAFSVMFVLFCLNFCFVSKITVVGNVSLTRAQVIEILKKSGVKYGTFAFFLDQRAVQKSIVENCDRISWAWVEIKGTHAKVEIREKIPMPELFDKDFACNIIASNEGVITRAISAGGILYAKVGTYVRKGDLLIGGVYDSTEVSPVRFIHASGEVLARTSYTAEDDFKCSYIKYSNAEKTKTAWGIRIGNLLIGKKIPPKNVLLINDTEKKLKIFGEFYLPLAFTKTKYCEIIEEKRVMSEAQVQKLATEELTARLKFVIPLGAAVDNCDKEITRNPDGSFHVRVTLECTENIGVESPIEFAQE